MNKTTSILVRLLSVALQLVYVKTYIHYLSVAELGYSSYLATLSYAVNALLLVPADLYQQACLVPSYGGICPLGSVLAFNKQLVMLAVALAVVLGIPVCLAGKLGFIDLILIFVLALFLYFSTSLQNYLNNRGHGLFTGWMLFLEAALKVSSFLVFVLHGMSHIRGFILSTVVAFFIEVIGLGIFFRNKVPYTLKETGVLDFRTMLVSSGAISFSAVCSWLQLQGYRIIYVWIGLAEIAGLYASVSNLGFMGMNALATVFQQMQLPKVYASSGAYIARYARDASILCVLVLLGYLALGKVLLLVLAKREFTPYASLMLFGILVAAGALLFGAASAYFTLRMATFQLLAANVAGLLAAGLGVAMCLVWRPHSYYLLGSVLAGSQAIVCATLFFEVRRDFRRRTVLA